MANYSATTFATCYVTVPKEAWSKHTVLSKLWTAVAQWLRCCATNRKVARSIPDGVIDIKTFRSHYGPGVDSVSNRNEYQEYLLG